MPITLQNFGVLVVGGALGLRRGGLAAFLYVALGVVGLPFFAEHKGGVSVILGATGGYLIGFVLAGALVGRLAELGWDRRIAGAIGATALGTLDDLPRRRAVARGDDRHVAGRGDRDRHAAVPRRRHGQAARGGGRVPGGLVGGRAAAERPLTLDAAPATAGDLERDGLYGPGSEAWRLNREAALLLGAGPRALLLQIAHPLVAEGVDQHSDFRADPWARLAGTLRSYLRIVYGTRPAARAEIRRLNGLHRAIGGPVRDAAAAARFGAAYEARDPGLSLWVHATLVDSTLATVDAWLGRDPARRPRPPSTPRPCRSPACSASPDALLPPDIDAFDAYVASMLAPDGPGPPDATARELAA